MLSSLGHAVSSAARSVCSLAMRYPITTAAGVGTIALGAGLTWRCLLKDKIAPELSQLLVTLDANGERGGLVCGLGELRLRSRVRWGWGTLARPLLFLAWSERRLQAAIDQFKSQLPEYARSIQHHRENYSNQKKLWIKGATPDQALLLPAAKELSDLHRGFSILQRERQLSLMEVGERYAGLAPLLHPTEIPNFQIFRAACRTIDDWSWPTRFRQKMGTLPIAALHHLLETLPDEEKIDKLIRQEWRELCERIVQQGMSPRLFYRTMVMAIYHSDKVPSSETPIWLGRIVCWLEQSFRFPLVEQDDPLWQRQVEREGIVSGDHKFMLGAPVDELRGCRLYEIGEEREQLLIAWKNELALCRFIERSTHFTLRSIDPTGLSARVARTFTLTSEEGRRLVNDSELVEMISWLVSEKRMPSCPFVEAIRIDQERRLIEMVEFSNAIRFDPLLIEAFLIKISPEKSHQWMQQSGAGSCKEAIEYRGAIHETSLSNLSMRMEEELRSYVNQFLERYQDPKPTSDEFFDWLRPQVVNRWAGENGLIGRLTDFFLKPFDQEAEKRFALKPPVLTDSDHSGSTSLSSTYSRPSLRQLLFCGAQADHEE